MVLQRRRAEAFIEPPDYIRATAGLAWSQPCARRGDRPAKTLEQLVDKPLPHHLNAREIEHHSVKLLQACGEGFVSRLRNSPPTRTSLILGVVRSTRLRWCRP